MTRQEVFGKVWQYFIVEKHDGAYNRDGGSYSPSAVGVTCWYRGPGDCRCAIGCVLPDELYNPAIEGLDVSDLLTNHDIALYFHGVGEEFLCRLQSAHDDLCSCWFKGRPDAWRERLREDLLDIAFEYDLEVPR